MSQLHRSYCRQCMALCGIVVAVEDDRIVAVRGDPDHPVTRGYTCPKGRAFGAMHHDPSRLDVPELRRDGELVAVSWDELLDDLAGRFARIINEDGPDAVATYVGSLSWWDQAGKTAGETLQRRIGSRSKYTSTTVDCPAKPLVAELVYGHPFFTPLPDLAGTGLLLVLGANPVVSHGHSWSLPDPVVALREVAGRGEVWVVDPRRTETARLATRHLRARPGTDHLVLGYLVRELLADGADREFLDRHAVHVEELCKAVDRFSVEFVADATGLPVADLTDLSGAVRRAGRIAVVTGTGVTMGAGANAAEWLAAALVLVTGSLDRPGGMWCNPGLLSRLDESGLQGWKSKPAPGPASRPDLPRRFGQYPCAALADEIQAGNVRAVVSLAGNPLVSFPDPDRLARAVAQLDVLAVADIRRTATVERATHVLPCAGAFERADATFGLDIAQPLVAAQYTRPLVPPGAQRRPLWWIMGQLGARLGYDVLPGGLHPDTATDDDVLDALAGAERMAALRAAPGGVASGPPRFGWILDQRDSPFDLAPPELVAELDRPFEPAELVLTPRRQVRHINSWFPPPGVRTDDAAVLLHPADAARAGVGEGQRVRVRTAAGAIEGIVRLDDGITPGAVSIPHGFDGARGTNVAHLISATAALDPLTGMVRQSGLPVELEPCDR